jgi:hypothetical protein
MVISIHIVVSWLIKGSKCVNCSLCDQKTNIKGINSITNNMHDERQTHNGNHCFVCDHLFFVQHRTIEDPDNFISISKASFYTSKGKIIGPKNIGIKYFWI